MRSRQQRCPLGCMQAVKNWEATNPQESVAERTEAVLAQCLSITDMPIRTGGEQRIGDFLLWQSANAELHKVPASHTQHTSRFNQTGEQVIQQQHTTMEAV